jgi:microcystin-dependent protein
MARNYSSIAGVKTLANDITSSSADQLTLSENTDDLPSPPFTLVINPDTAKEEIVTVLADQTGVSEPTYKIARGQEGTTPTTHTQGDIVKHMITGRDLQEPHDHMSATEAHGATGAVVGTTNTQTLTNKTLTTPKVNENVALTATSTELNVLDGITASTTELNYTDGVTSAIQTQLNTLFGNTPVGTIVMYGANAAPTGWLLCNGQSTASYPALAAVVGANVPDLMGRAPIGWGAGSGLTDRTTIGAKLGAQTHTLSVDEMPSHNHPFDASDGLGLTNRTHFMDRNASHGHGMDGVGDHTHSITSKWSGAQTHDHAGTGSIGSVASGPDTSGGTETQTSTNGAGSHAHGIHGTDINHRHTIQAQGGGAAHNNMQPSTVVNFIIKH